MKGVNQHHVFYKMEKVIRCFRCLYLQNHLILQFLISVRISECQTECPLRKMILPKSEYANVELLMWTIRIDRIGVKSNLSCIIFLHYSLKIPILHISINWKCKKFVIYMPYLFSVKRTHLSLQAYWKMAIAGWTEFAKKW